MSLTLPGKTKSRLSPMAPLHDIAPLQLYASGLIFAPEMAVTRRNFKKDLPDWLSRGPNVEEDWSPELKTLEGHSDWVNSVAFSADGRLLASGSADHTIKLWDPATGALRHTLESQGVVNDIKFSERFPQLVTNVGSFNIRVWLESFTSRLPETENEVSLQANRWVAINSQKELWLPSDSYPVSSAIYNTTIALGCRNGRVCVITFTT
ncbi:WD40 repeat domain-containing protein [Aspergillus stella-maris]|uniref:WD40 repeat domain-containing protein n=1 Tax=Aspergillus stella-maris TaxID=1810926 RepID=UPI003CCCAEB3